MKFDLFGLIMNPFVLMFITVAIGLLFGKLRVGRFSFGTSGTLFSGLLIGWLMYKLGSKIVSEGSDAAGYDAAQAMLDAGIIHSNFFDAFLIFFVAAVGLLAAKDMGIIVKKYGKVFVVIGIVTTLVGAAGAYAATAVLYDTDAYEVAGVYTGALTSSPGLGAALEAAQSQATEYADRYEDLSEGQKKQVLLVIDDSGALTPENTPKLTKDQKQTYISDAQAGVGVGHAIGYPFGVIIVILAANFLTSLFGIDVEDEKRRYALEMEEARKTIKVRQVETGPFSAISFVVTCVVGYLVGSIEIYLGPLGYFSLGSTGGVLILGLVLGYIGKIGPLRFKMDPVVLGMLRELCLAFFLAVVGLRYGYKTFDSILGSGIELVIVSTLIAIIATMAAFLLGRYVFKLNWVLLVGAICGGMTSTPGLGAAIDALDSDEPAAGYGATYPFALLGMIVFTILLHRLPLL